MERLVSLAIFFIIGFFAQFIDGTVGMGYGAFSASVLIGMGIMPVLASASIHTAEIFTTFFSGISHLKFGNVKKNWLLPLIIPGMVGGAIGAPLAGSIFDATGSYRSAFLICVALCGLALILSLILLRSKVKGTQAPLNHQDMSNSAIIGSGLNRVNGGIK